MKPLSSWLTDPMTIAIATIAFLVLMVLFMIKNTNKKD